MASKSCGFDCTCRAFLAFLVMYRLRRMLTQTRGALATHSNSTSQQVVAHKTPCHTVMVVVVVVGMEVEEVEI